MAAADLPQFYQNNLSPVSITKESLEKTLKELQIAVNHGAGLLQEGCRPQKDWGKTYNTGLYVGFPGIALAFLRLDHQVKTLSNSDVGLPLDFRNLANERILSHGPDVPLLPERVSPFGSHSVLVGPFMRLLAAAQSGGSISEVDIECLRNVVQVALTNSHLLPHGDRMMGTDEVLNGRAGLLWAVLSVRAHEYDEQARELLAPIFDYVPKLIDAIITGGLEGRKDYTKKHGEKNALPLMWHWDDDRYYIGAVHGACGIIASLLACDPGELNDSASRNYLPLIAETITDLCKICIAHNGHLPTSIPDRGPSSRRSSPLVQICHGSPGMLALMACARRNSPLTSDYWQPEWDLAIRLASERVWEEGLLSKGGGVCHGITGNAWPLLLLHDSFQYDDKEMQVAKRNYMERTQTTDPRSIEHGLTGDFFLSKALSFMLQARETPPYYNSANIYRLPDHPFSLAEGLAGTLCAWADTCVAIQMRLQSMSLHEARPNCSSSSSMAEPAFQGPGTLHLGIPTLAYHRPAA
ncbi:lanthionine synthetase C family protein [Aspergillus heteromorphus CBS 117.55]|uniref:Lanthionine synthetase C family protein n=1 Tax=Aspergillus heteromorphus CBS 117.55 TaxID=1448321 RepID=A0A317VRQ6_9EURO|nr:lanthionine synthetase C family protein [Aspergillus heteromorphus CBS 117.55]PWY76249.1 lanthionine synthetase C family protein [Aspergillus heteromorphus CBS 117.55]